MQYSFLVYNATWLIRHNILGYKSVYIPIGYAPELNFTCPKIGKFKALWFHAAAAHLGIKWSVYGNLPGKNLQERNADKYRVLQEYQTRETSVNC